MSIRPIDDFFTNPASKGAKLASSLRTKLGSTIKDPFTGLPKTTTQGVISRSNLEAKNIYGTSEDFLNEYENFQKTYFKALETDIDPLRASKVDIGMLKRGEKIDLSVLNASTRRSLEQIYVNRVLRLPEIIKNLGLPDLNLPSANLYRELFRYRVDTASSPGTTPHAGAVVLNRTLLNVDPNKSGMDAINVGVSNLMGFKKLKQNTRKSLKDLLDGKKVHTFDIESTGIFAGAEARSAAIAETSATGSIRLLEDETILFGSKQLTGISVGGAGGSPVKSFTEAMYEGRGSKILGFKDGGEEFLNASEKFVRKLTEADVVAGHNVLYDISTLFRTIKGMPAFESHKGIQEALSAFDEKWAKNEDFVVDTLDYARTYLNDRINNAVESSRLTGTDELNKFRDLLFSEDFMSKIHLGGSTATSSMEAISVNTNLLHLIQDEARTGDAAAASLIRELAAGTHIETTDATLQSYMARFITTGQLDVMDTTERASRARLKDPVTRRFNLWKYKKNTIKDFSFFSRYDNDKHIGRNSYVRNRTTIRNF